jgi:hypothetical protein
MIRPPPKGTPKATAPLPGIGDPDTAKGRWRERQAAMAEGQW